MIGGSCIKIARIPSKALIRSAQLIELARRAVSLGLVPAGPGATDMAVSPPAQRRSWLGWSR
jgi:pyruvate/2-oxoglutarate dehydrogenase complex dihydrolipoamide dehydrogenase (E3) component